MRTTVFILAVIVSGCSSAAALADECEAIVADLVAREGAIAEQRTPAGQIPLKHPLASEVVVECPTAPGAPIDLYLNWDGAFPPRTFYEFAGRAGQIVTAAQAGVVKQGAMKCQRAALRSRNEMANTTVGGIAFECQAFTRDGGGTAITIYRK